MVPLQKNLILDVGQSLLKIERARRAKHEFDLAGLPGKPDVLRAADVAREPPHPHTGVDEAPRRRHRARSRTDQQRTPAGEMRESGNETHRDKFPVDENYFPYRKENGGANRKIFYHQMNATWNDR
jgi:hypothetical protein